jgi:hypothetical protein
MNGPSNAQKQDALIKTLQGTDQAKAVLRDWLLVLPEECRNEVTLACKEIIEEAKDIYPGGSPFAFLVSCAKKQDPKEIAHFFIREFGIMEIHAVLIGAMLDDLRAESHPKSAEGAD